MPVIQRFRNLQKFYWSNLCSDVEDKSSMAFSVCYCHKGLWYVTKILYLIGRHISLPSLVERLLIGSQFSAWLENIQISFMIYCTVCLPLLWIVYCLWLLTELLLDCVFRCVKSTASVCVSLSAALLFPLKDLTASTNPPPPGPPLDIHLLHRYI